MHLKRAIKSQVRPVASWALQRLNVLRDAEAVKTYDFAPSDVQAVKDLMVRYAATKREIRAINWLLASVKHPLFGGVYTILRFADYFAREKGIQNRLVFYGSENTTLPALKDKIRSRFPSLVDSISILPDGDPAKLPPSEISVATFWTSAYLLLHARNTSAKFYFIQDFEPSFYPGGATYGLAEATYRMGFWGIANTAVLGDFVRDAYGTTVKSFQPAVDPKIFFPPETRAPRPIRVFFYGRPGHPRNGFALGIEALKQVKKRFGKEVEIVSAGGAWNPSDFGAKHVVENLGLLTSIKDVAALYRTCHIGLAFMFSKHPSYQPLEMMASGVVVVANENSALRTVLKNGENALVAEPTASSIAEAISALLSDESLRKRLAAEGAKASQQTCWKKEMEEVYKYMVGQRGDAVDVAATEHPVS